jgi:hypothetical protein
MRYKLPEGTGSVSVHGLQFDADEEGYIHVPSEGDQSIHATIQNTDHGLGLTAEPDPEPAEAGAEAPVETDPRKRKRQVLNAIAGFGVRVDGRRALEELETVLAEAREARAKQLEGRALVADAVLAADREAADKQRARTEAVSGLVAPDNVATGLYHPAEVHAANEHQARADTLAATAREQAVYQAVIPPEPEPVIASEGADVRTGPPAPADDIATPPPSHGGTGVMDAHGAVVLAA